MRRENNRKYWLSGLICFSLLISSAMGQENSPFSRFGLGDLLQSSNVYNRGMGGLTIAQQDVQSVNFINPASYSRLKVTTYDVGIEYLSRSLKPLNSTDKFNSANLIPTYLNIAFPLSKKKNIGMNIGLRPMTRIQYDVFSKSKQGDLDTLFTQYAGTGGSYQSFMGFGYGTKNFSIGVNGGYLFGNKQFATKRTLLSDSVTYQRALFADSVRYGGLFAEFGIMYNIPLGKTMSLKLGATYHLQHTMNAYRNLTRETYQNGTKGLVQIDSVYRMIDQKGTINAPSSYGIGVMLEKENKWKAGVEYNSTQWSQYRYYNTTDAVQDNWTMRLGTEVVPDIKSTNYWSRVSYRAGYYFGNDYVNVAGNLKTAAFTFGAGLPMRRNFYTNQFTTINVAIEIGNRGTKVNAYRETFFRFAVGMNLSDIWFTKRKYQ
ncbi:MAG: hypothetical protein ACO29O_05930 [Chitinophagaceae bacterium]